jgi:hypothetical protein
LNTIYIALRLFHSVKELLSYVTESCSFENAPENRERKVQLKMSSNRAVRHALAVDRNEHVDDEVASSDDGEIDCNIDQDNSSASADEAQDVTTTPATMSDGIQQASSESDALSPVYYEEEEATRAIPTDSGEQGSLEDDERDASDDRSSANQALSTASVDRSSENDTQQDDTNETVEQQDTSSIHEFLRLAEFRNILAVILEKETSSPPEGRPAIVATMSKKQKVQLHSLNAAASRNGQVGTVLTYAPAKDRFMVDVDGTKLALLARNLRVVHESSKGEDESSVDISKRKMTSDVLLMSLFQPGMLLLGTIEIPGLLGAPGRREYRLVVDSLQATDEMGKPTGIPARHCAYDDEQFVFIQVKLKDDDNGNVDDMELSIHYSDEETQCQGTWNHAKGQFEGTVRQLLPTEDGGSIYHACDEVTHTFTLSPTTALYPNGVAAFLDEQREGRNDDEDDCNAKDDLRLTWEQDLVSPATVSLANHRHNLDQLSFRLVDQFLDVSRRMHALRQSADSNSYEELHNFQLRFKTQVSWSDLLIADSKAAEVTCARFRRWAELLDGLSFSSAVDRAQVLANLRQKGVTRARAHTESDNRKETAREIVEAWSYATMPGSQSAPGQDEMTRILVICSRLERNFARFDGALRRAEERLTDADIRQWIVSPSSGASDGSGDETICTICHVDLEGEDAVGDTGVLRLPCSHSFHGECLREWLQHHSQCPMCRLELRQ